MAQSSTSVAGGWERSIVPPQGHSGGAEDRLRVLLYCCMLFLFVCFLFRCMLQSQWLWRELMTVGIKVLTIVMDCILGTYNSTIVTPGPHFRVNVWKRFWWQYHCYTVVIKYCSCFLLGKFSQGWNSEIPLKLWIEFIPIKCLALSTSKKNYLNTLSIMQNTLTYIIQWLCFAKLSFFSM